MGLSAGECANTMCVIFVLTEWVLHGYRCGARRGCRFLMFRPGGRLGV